MDDYTTGFLNYLYFKEKKCIFIATDLREQKALNTDSKKYNRLISTNLENTATIFFSLRLSLTIIVNDKINVPRKLLLTDRRIS